MSTSPSPVQHPALDLGAGGAERVAARLRACFDQSPLPRALVGLDSRVTAANAAFCALVGRPRERVLWADLCEFLHAEQPGRGQLGALLAGGAADAQFERQLVDADGRPLPVQVDAVLITSSDGTPLEASLVLQDLRAVRDVERRRQQQEDFFLALGQRATDMALVGDAEGRLVYVSPAAQHVLGHEPADTLGSLGWDFVHPEDLPTAQAAYAKVVEHGTTETFVLRVRTGDGSWRWVEETAANLLETAVGGIVCNLRDITEQVEAVQALSASEARFRAIAETAEEGIWVAAPSGQTVYANGRVARMLGLQAEEVAQQRPHDLLDAEQAAAMVARMTSRQAAGNERYEVGYDHPDGTRRQFVVRASPLPAPDGGHLGSLAMIYDVTDARRVEEQLRRAALHDALTGLPNRTLLRDRLEQVVSRQRAAGASTDVAVLMVDLDHFKLINDSQGHDVGDSLLVAVAERLRELTPAVDTVARFGGDEFVVVCGETDEQGARELGEALVAALREPFEVEGRTVRVAASVGIALPRDAEADDLLRFADAALHAAKAAGRGTVSVFAPHLAEDLERRYAMAADLRVALEQDELRLDYQPLVDLASGRVVGVEALARWRHPTLGEVPPDRFVEVAEETGLVVQLDAWAVETALRCTADLRRRGLLGPDVAVSVNLSAKTLTGLPLEALLTALVEELDVPAGLVVLEVTESAVMADAERAVDVLRRLRQRGFHVAVDDFGTGYSSLAYLRDLPVTSLKIDRSFVAGIVEDRDALAIVASVVDLARAIGVDVVAEGVETSEQAALLRRLGCGTAQGWLWSPALSVAQVEEVAGTWRTGYTSGSARPPRVAQRPGDRWEVLPEHGGERLLELHRAGASLTTIAAALNSEGYRTPTGARWHRTTVARTVSQAAYPELSGVG